MHKTTYAQAHSSHLLAHTFLFCKERRRLLFGFMLQLHEKQRDINPLSKPLDQIVHLSLDTKANDSVVVQRKTECTVPGSLCYCSNARLPVGNPSEKKGGRRSDSSHLNRKHLYYVRRASLAAAYTFVCVSPTASA